MEVSNHIPTVCALGHVRVTKGETPSQLPLTTTDSLPEYLP
jgi:hypothetical protein